MKFKGAVICEQGRTFAVISVKQEVIDDPAQADDVIAGLAPVFPGLPIILIRPDTMGGASYYGDSEIAAIMKDVSTRAIPLREYAWDD